MKKIFVLLIAVLPILLHAGVIVKQSGESLDGVNIKSVTDTEIVYITSSGKEESMLKSEATAILYDDGRYEEIKQSIFPASQGQTDFDNQDMSDEGKEQAINVLAYGNSVMKIYKADHEFDGSTVEYRVFYKGRDGESEWMYLGTTPFFYATSKGAKDAFLGKEAQDLAENRPLYVDNWKNVKKVEFRLSKEGYETVVVTPLIQVSFTGLYYFLSLNKLKPIDVSTKEKAPKASKKNADTSTSAQPKKQKADKKVQKNKEDENDTLDAEQKVADTRMIPQGCLNEGKKAYDKAFEEASAKAMRQGYSKSQAKKIAELVAPKAQEKTINDCYHRVVELDEEYDFKKSKITVEIDEFYSDVMASDAIKEMIPDACDDYAQKAYDKAYEAAFAKAKKKGYSKSQAEKVADDAALIEKQKALDECYNRVVTKGEDYAVIESSKVKDKDQGKDKGKDKGKGKGKSKKQNNSNKQNSSKAKQSKNKK